MRQPSTPCVDICVIDQKTKLCVGCGRTSGEISAWRSMSERERVALMKLLPGRLKSLSQ